MDHKIIIEKLDKNYQVFQSLLENITENQAMWKPTPEKWSLLEVVNHLYDEEREDFRQRIALVLEDSNKSWPPIDPDGWVSTREYYKRKMKSSLSNFLQEREKSIRWLRSLNSPDWKVYYKHPQLGDMSAEVILANWLAHDYLHIRQIDFLLWAYLSNIAPSINLNYAGSW
jgi:hypothetical protein